MQVTKESTDDYVGRMQGYLLLLAAMTQSDNPSNPHGLSQAWSYLARWAVGQGVGWRGWAGGWAGEDTCCWVGGWGG